MPTETSKELFNWNISCL